MMRRGLAAVGVELLLALALAWAAFAIGGCGGSGLHPMVTGRTAGRDTGGLILVLLTSLGVLAMALMVPVVALLDRQPRLVVRGLPGLRSTRPRPPVRLLRMGVGGVLLLVLIVLALGWRVPALALVAVTDLGLLAVLIRLRSELHGRSARRRALTEALTAYRPRFVVYTARRNDASYQLAMWVPQLEKLGLPYLVVVRHAEAIEHAREVTSAPVICCPSGADLDALLVPSLRAAFYVNGVSENTNFVLYRQLQHIYLGHGDSDKEMSVHPMHAMFDRIFVAGQAAVDRYTEAGVQIDPTKFVIVGRPQLADLADRPVAGSSTGSGADSGARSGADPGADGSDPVTGRPPRALLAPTWRGYNAISSVSSLPVGTEIAAALIAGGAEVVFRPHPFSWLGAERDQIEAVDAVLQADRRVSGRRHRLAAENRSTTLGENFDDSDALVTDVGSVLVDYFATEKPYAVVLPCGLDPATAVDRFPSTVAAYRVPADRLAGDRTAGRDWVRELLVDDPQAGERARVRRHYLGDRPRDDRPFLEAARTMVIGPTGRAGSDRFGSDRAESDQLGDGRDRARVKTWAEPVVASEASLPETAGEARS